MNINTLCVGAAMALASLRNCAGSPERLLFDTVISNYMYMQISCTGSKTYLSYDVPSGSEITPCNKIDKLLVSYR